MPISNVEIYSRIQQLLQSVPENVADQNSVLEWATKSDVLIEFFNHDGENVEMSDAISYIKDGFLRETQKDIHEGVLGIKTCLTRCLYRLELTGDIETSSSFIPATNELDALTAVGRVFSRAKNELMLIDPYADEVLFSDFLRFADESVTIKILGSGRGIQSKLGVPLKRWRIQYPNRSTKVRKCQKNILHDRLIIVDEIETWLLSQSFNGIAKRAHAYLVQADAELSKLKVNSYKEIWELGDELTV